jgi:hypothetical protein
MRFDSMMQFYCCLPIDEAMKCDEKDPLNLINFMNQRIACVVSNLATLQGCFNAKTKQKKIIIQKLLAHLV